MAKRITPRKKRDDEIRTSRLVITDDAGRERACLETIKDAVLLSMCDRKGNLRLTARVAENGEATFNTFSKGRGRSNKVVPRMRIGCEALHPEIAEMRGNNIPICSLTLYDEMGKARGEFRLPSTQNGAHLMLTGDADGNQTSLEHGRLLLWRGNSEAVCLPRYGDEIDQRKLNKLMGRAQKTKKKGGKQ
jgi:hypothetical protein